MNIFKLWINKYWWVILILIFLYFTTVSVVNNKCLNRITKEVLEYFNLLVKPVGVILGLVLGYPLLKKKVVEGYVTKQFNIIDDANRKVRNSCLDLLDKYPVAGISNHLTKEHVDEILVDLKELKNTAIDANRDVYKYIRLVYVSLLKFQTTTTPDIPSRWKVNYYIETLNTFMHMHIQSIYDLSSSIVYVPSNDIKKNKLLSEKLEKYTSDNDTYTVEGFDRSLSFYRDSALLVLFYENNLNTLSNDNGLLFKCCYESAPTPSILARIVYASNLYIPLVLTGKTIENIHTPRLYLTGYKRESSIKWFSGIETHYLTCHYANISNFGFVEGIIKDKQSLLEYKDTYLNTSIFNIDDIEEFDIDKEKLILKIDERKAMAYFNIIKNELKRKMAEESK